MRITALLAEKQVAFESLPHAPAFSAQKRAKWLGVPGTQVAKGVLLRGPTGYVVAVLPATHRVDTDRLARDLGGPVWLASDREIAEVFRDCEWGVVPPFGRLYGVRTLLDDGISPETQLVLETHTQFEAVRLRCRDFERLERPCRLPFARRDEPPDLSRGA